MINVLYVDDEQDMLTLVKQFLESMGEFSVRTCDSAKRALDDLSEATTDVIVSDYQMPVMDGIHFLKEIRASGKTLPFILFTGKGREQVVIEALNCGADFYLQKGGDPKAQFAELAHKIRMVVEHRKNQENLLKSEAKFRQVFEDSFVALVLTDEEGRVTEWNARAETISGIAKRDAIGRHVWDVQADMYPHGTSGELHQLLKNRLMDTLRTGVPPWASGRQFEGMLRRKDGGISFFQQEIFTLRTEKGYMLYFVTWDVSERHKMEQEARENEAKYRALFNNENDMVFLNSYDDEGRMSRFIEVNDTACQRLGYSRDELLNMTPSDLYAAESPPTEPKRSQAIIEGSLSMFEVGLRSRDGSALQVEVNTKRFAMDGREVILSVVRDIADRKAADEQLRRKANKLSALYEVISIGTRSMPFEELLSETLQAAIRVMEFDVGGIYLVNWKTRRAELVLSKGLHPNLMAQLEDRPIDIEPYSGLFLEGIPIFLDNYPEIAPKLAADSGIASIASVPLIGGEGAIGAINVGSKRRFGFTQDERDLLIAMGRELGAAIELRLAHETSAKAHLNLKTLFESMEDIVFVTDLDGRILDVNQPAISRLGYSRDELVGQDVLMVHVPERRNEAACVLKDNIDGRSKWCHVPICSKFGEVIEVETRIGRGTWDGKECIFGITRDTTDLKRAEQAARMSEERYRLISDNMTDLICLHDLDSVYVYVSPSCKALLGYDPEEMIGLSPYDFFHPEDRERILMASHEGILKDASTQLLVYRFRRKDGSWIWFETVVRKILDENGDRTYIQTTSRDVTQRKQAEEALRHANRQLNLLTQITRHDILNKLLIIQGNISLIEDESVDKGLDARLRKVNRVREAADSIQAQIEFTRVFQELGAREPTWQDVGATLSRVRSAEGLSITCSCNGVEILADPMLEKVFFNLLDNSERHGSTVTHIDVRCLPRPDCLAIIWEDDGLGVRKEEKEAIFERGHGKNMGLGLFLVREILSITGMTIKETGEEGMGARFEIRVPLECYRGHDAATGC